MATFSRIRTRLPEAPVAWLALRAALQLGVLDTLDGDGPHTVADIAARTGVDLGTLGPLLAVLGEAGAVTEAPLALAPAARELPRASRRRTWSSRPARSRR